MVLAEMATKLREVSERYGGIPDYLSAAGEIDRTASEFFKNQAAVKKFEFLDSKNNAARGVCAPDTGTQVSLIETDDALIVASGGRVEQETLHFDPASGSLTSLRSKEEAHDYRYFPEPDLLPLAPSPEHVEEVRASLPELPAERRVRYESELGLSPDAAKLLAYDAALASFY